MCVDDCYFINAIPAVYVTGSSSRSYFLYSYPWYRGVEEPFINYFEDKYGGKSSEFQQWKKLINNDLYL